MTLLRLYLPLNLSEPKLQPLSIIVTTEETPNCHRKADTLCQQLSTLPNILLLDNTQPIDNTIYHLHVSEQQLELRGGIFDKTTNPLFIDFLAGKMQYRLKQGSANREQIAKAMGLKGQIRPNIWDTTAGLGRDAFILAALGCQIHLIERSPILFFLLQDGLERAALDPIAGPITARMHLRLGDAYHILQELESNSQNTPLPDIIYLDPMYPSSTKSALNKKEMRIIREIVGADDDADKLLAAALTKAKNRVVVKRPRSGEPLKGPRPHFSIKGTSNRYDIYLTKIISFKEY